MGAAAEPDDIQSEGVADWSGGALPATLCRGLCRIRATEDVVVSSVYGFSDSEVSFC